MGYEYQIISGCVDETLEEYPEHLDFCSLETGKTAVLTLKWEKLGKTTYPEVRHIDFEEREPYDEKILEDIPNLDDLLVVRSYEEIENLFYELIMKMIPFLQTMIQMMIVTLIVMMIPNHLYLGENVKLSSRIQKKDEEKASQEITYP